MITKNKAYPQADHGLFHMYINRSSNPQRLYFETYVKTKYFCISFTVKIKLIDALPAGLAQFVACILCIQQFCQDTK